MIPQLTTLARVTRIGCWLGGRWVFWTLDDTTWAIWRHIMFFIFFYVGALGHIAFDWMRFFLPLWNSTTVMWIWKCRPLSTSGYVWVKFHFWVHYPFKELYFRQMNIFPLFSTDELKSSSLYIIAISWELYTGQILADSSSACQHEFRIIIHL